MAANKYLANNSGNIVETVPAVTSAANAIVALDSTGHLDISVMPVGVGAETVVCVSSENLAAGAFVNIYLNGGVATARNADCTTNAKPAIGYVLSAVTSPVNATVFLLGTNNTAVTALTIGSTYYLSTVGGVTTTAPSTTGNIVQELGLAVLTTQITTYSKPTIQIA
jgi:hypothetical protein